MNEKQFERWVMGNNFFAFRHSRSRKGCTHTSERRWNKKCGGETMDELGRMLVPWNDEGLALKASRGNVAQKHVFPAQLLKSVCLLSGDRGQLCAGSRTPRGCRKFCTINRPLAKETKKLQRVREVLRLCNRVSEQWWSSCRITKH